MDLLCPSLVERDALPVGGVGSEVERLGVSAWQGLCQCMGQQTEGVLERMCLVVEGCPQVLALIGSWIASWLVDEEAPVPPPLHQWIFGASSRHVEAPVLVGNELGCSHN